MTNILSAAPSVSWLYQQVFFWKVVMIDDAIRNHPESKNTHNE